MAALWLSMSFLLASSTAAAQQPADLSTLQYQDLRLAELSEKMLHANRQLCTRLMPITGMVLHTSDQYSGEPGEAFANGAVAVALVLPGSAAERASLAAGDSISAINGTSLASIPDPDEGPRRDAVFEVLAQQDPEQSLTLRIARGGSTFDVVLDAEPGCRALVEIVAERGTIARSDGRVIQLSYGLASRLSDQALAAVFAHEMAHLVLEHRRRLSEAGISKGFFAEFGRNRQGNRQAEVEADRLSVHLLANAGFDPQLGPEFWLSKEGRRVGGGLLRSAIYPSPKTRAEIMRREIADHLPPDAAPSLPEHLLAQRKVEF